MTTTTPKQNLIQRTVRTWAIQRLLFRARWKRQVDGFYRWLAWRLPRQLVGWCGIRVLAHATTGRNSDRTPSEINIMDALSMWNDPGHAG